MPILALEATQPPIQWVPQALSPWVNWLGHEADHSPTSTAQGISAAIPLLPLHRVHTANFTFHFLLASIQQVQTFYKCITLHTLLTQMFIYKGVSASDSDTDCYVIITKSLFATHFWCSCIRGKCRHNELILQQDLFSTTKLVSFQNSHEVPVKQMATLLSQ
jgi:hypothetical protein